MTPGRLDLRAIEARIDNPADAGNLDFFGNSIRDIRALLAYCRALRAALHDTVVALDDLLRSTRPEYDAAYQARMRAVAVLAAAGDAAGAAPEREDP